MADRPEYQTIILRIVVLAVLGSVIGLVVALLALVFLEAISWLNNLLLISPSERFKYVDNLKALNIATVLVPTLGGLVVGLVLRYLVDARRPLGPPDTILMVQTHTSGESVRSGLMSTLAAIISLGCGASVGQYGPLVYLGSIVGAAANKLKLNKHNLREITVASGVAAAISVAFNAPIAGLIFAHEVILRHYSIQAFAPTAVATAIGYVIVNVVFHRPSLFLVEFDGVQHGYEFLLFAVVGVLSAFIAISYAKGILACDAFAKRTRIPIAFRPMIAGFFLGVVALWIPDVLGIGGTTLRFATIEGAFQLSELGLIIVAKFAVTVLCIGFGFAGGVFSPILLIGILFGALFGGILDNLTFIEHSGVVTYAICGMMAAASPIVGAPLAMILIVFELTHSYDLAIAAMVAVVFSNLISTRIFGRSLYDVQLIQRGFDLSHGRRNAVLAYEKITSLMHDQYLRFDAADKIETVMSKLSSGSHNQGFVTDSNGVFIGVVHFESCSNRDPSEIVKYAAQLPHFTFTEKTNLIEAVEALRIVNLDIAPIVSSTDNKLLGVVWNYDVMNAYLRAIERIESEENASV